jgi:hypothetical protein
MLTMLLPPFPRAARPIDLMERDMPEQLEVVVDREFDPLRLVALFNFEDNAKDVTHALPPGRWHAFDVWSDRYLGVREGGVECALVEPHGCRVLALRPERGVPQIVGTTAHLGSGWLDITEQSWSDQRLDLRLAPAGQRARTVTIATVERSVDRVSIDGRETPYAQRQGGCVVPLVVDEPCRLELSFRDGAPR